MKFTVKKQWRGVGDQAYDVFHRGTKREIERAGSVGVAEPLWAVINGGTVVICDCYCRDDAVLIAVALNKMVPQ